MAERGRRARPPVSEGRPDPVETGGTPEVLLVRVPGLDYDIELGGERWRCQVARRDPALFVLTVLDRA
jgi:hypothetical protein